jgi:hypothetical protein
MRKRFRVVMNASTKSNSPPARNEYTIGGVTLMVNSSCVEGQLSAKAANDNGGMEVSFLAFTGKFLLLTTWTLAKTL